MLFSWSLVAQEFSLGPERVLPAPRPALPIYRYSPDGHCAVLSHRNLLTMFWPGEDSYRSCGPSLFQMSGCVKVLPKGACDSFDNGGAWLYSVFRRGDRRLLGFYHAEDHRFPLSPESRFTAYKSIARCVSNDLGFSWGEREQILTARRPKPGRAGWSGLGDHCVVWDEARRSYVCIFQEGAKLCMATSEDAEGRPGTWRKWYQGGFSQPGIGGRATPIAAFKNHQGGNPSVIWSTFLKRWIMVWHRWEGDIWISTSPDLTSWSPPKLLLPRPPGGGKRWYPTLVGQSDTTGGRSVNLLYAEFTETSSSVRRFLIRKMVFLQ